MQQDFQLPHRRSRKKPILPTTPFNKTSYIYHICVTNGEVFSGGNLSIRFVPVPPLTPTLHPFSKAKENLYICSCFPAKLSTPYCPGQVPNPCRLDPLLTLRWPPIWHSETRRAAMITQAEGLLWSHASGMMAAPSHIPSAAPGATASF